MGGATGREVSRREVSRRDILKGAGLGVGAVLAAGAAAEGAGSPGDEAPLFTGYIESIEHPRTAYVAVYDQGTVRVDFSEHATFVRDGNVSINAFQAGDQVAVAGDWVGDAVAGEAMEVMYELREGRIRGRSEDRLDTTAGPMLLVDGTEPMEGSQTTPRPVDELGPGDLVLAGGRVDPSAGEFVALRIGVLDR